MLTLLIVVHLLIGLTLMVFVLLQDPKDGAMGMFSGGSSSNSFFGSSGASTFLEKGTRWLGVLFAVSCLTLTYLTTKGGSSVMDKLPASNSTQQSAPSTTPAPAPAPTKAPATK